MQIYIHRNNQQLGPFSDTEIRAQLAAGTLSPQDHAWWEGQANWVPLSQTPFGAVPAPAVPGGVPLPPGTAAAPHLPVSGGTTSNLAIWSLVCSCVALICGLLASIPGIVLGHLALNDIKKNPHLQGKGMAIAGLVIGYMMTLLYVVILAVYLAMIPTIIKAAQHNAATPTITP